MKTVSVITGGASGMGFEAARLIGKEHHLVIVDVVAEKLEQAVEALRAEGIEADGFLCDVSNREAVQGLVNYAAGLGEIASVVHSAGVSPHMGDGEKIFRINALGTIYMDEEFAKVMPKESCILNVASMASCGVNLYEKPEIAEIWKLSLTDEAAFFKAAAAYLQNIEDAEMRSSYAYTISKNFVTWYTRHKAMEYGKKGIRIVSISPGTFSTPMGKLEGDAAAVCALNGALGRLGEPVEIAKMMAFIVSKECSYLTGTDILYDGGATCAWL